MKIITDVCDQTSGQTGYYYKETNERHGYDLSTGIPLVYSGLSGQDTTDFESQSFFHDAKK